MKPWKINIELRKIKKKLQKKEKKAELILNHADPNNKIESVIEKYKCIICDVKIVIFEI